MTSSPPKKKKNHRGAWNRWQSSKPFQWNWWKHTLQMSVDISAGSSHKLSWPRSRLCWHFQLLIMLAFYSHFSVETYRWHYGYCWKSNALVTGILGQMVNYIFFRAWRMPTATRSYANTLKYKYLILKIYRKRFFNNVSLQVFASIEKIL